MRTVESIAQSIRDFADRIEYWGVPQIDQMEQLVKDYGTVCRLDLPMRPPIVLLADPEATRVACQAEEKNPVKNAFAALAHYRTSKGWRVGLAAAEGAEWKEFRELGQRVLGGPQSVIKYVGRNAEVADMFIAYLREVRDAQNSASNVASSSASGKVSSSASGAAANTANVVTNFQEHAKLWSFESMTMMVLGKPVGIFRNNAEARRLFDASDDLFACFAIQAHALPTWKLLKTPLYRRMARSVDVAREICGGYVEQALRHPPPDSMLAQLGCDIAAPRQRAMVLDVFTDILFSAVDTTSTTLTYLLHCLAVNPECQRRARREVLRLLPDPADPVTPQAANQMSYLKACLKEALRVHHVVMGTSRLLTRHAVLGGYLVPAGTNWLVLSSVMSSDPSLFAGPETFTPERWIRGDPQYTKPPKFGYLPFGYGPRMCIGRRFAELETWVTAAQLLRNFEIVAVTEKFGQVLQLINVPDRPIDLQLVDLPAPARAARSAAVVT